MAGFHSFSEMKNRSQKGKAGSTFKFSSGLEDRLPDEKAVDKSTKKRVAEILGNTIRNINESMDGLSRVFTTSAPRGKDVTEIGGQLKHAFPGTIVETVRNPVSHEDEWRVSVPIHYSRRRLCTRPLLAFAALLVLLALACLIFLYVRVFKYEDGFNIIATNLRNAMPQTLRRMWQENH